MSAGHKNDSRPLKNEGAELERFSQLVKRIIDVPKSEITPKPPIKKGTRGK